MLQHVHDARPAWLWSQDGQILLWQNEAAGLFLAKLKKSGLKRAALAVPLKGQVSRNIRLGSSGRTSLARIQFLAGDKPASATCATTPLPWQDNQMALLVVGVDPIAADVLAAGRSDIDLEPEAGGIAVPDAGAPPVADGAEPQVQASPDEESAAGPVAAAAPAIADAAPDGDERPDNGAGEALPAPAGEETQAVAAFAADAERDAPPPRPELEAAEDVYTDDVSDWAEAETGTAEEPAATAVEPEPEAPQPPDVQEHGPTRLSRLLERLSGDEALFMPLTDADDALLTEPGTVSENEAPAAGSAAQLYRITGRGFAADAQSETIPDADVTPGPASTTEMPAPEPAGEDMAAEQVRRMEEALREIAPPAADAESVERVSRYNFDELARILNDRISEPARPPAPPAPTQTTGALVNLGGETLVLNRLPLGILVFRDQQVLFANRAITEMVGYDSVEDLRSAGLSAVFPAAGPEGQEAGPVNHLVQRDGTLVPVTARLQSISWHGRPALMLSASTTEVRTGHEAAVRAFAQSFADIRGDGFFETNRAGTVSAITPKAALLLGQEGVKIEGRALTGLINAGDAPALREFLERPARFADTARPCITLRSATGRAEINLFAQGQAGVITGYFGFVRTRETAPLRITGPLEADPALLARISRGVRRPLNTIIGFSDLIRSQAFGALDNARYEEYARDIATAGQEIAALVDELDDYARLRDGRYLPQRASIDLTSLLEGCVLRIRQQASGARVIVRNAISERLPKVTADRASLAQAVLNLLASAIDQTPTGGAVVISAQREDDGGIAIHVRDSSVTPVDMAERFVVFRDGVGRDGQAVGPVRSSVGLALTRSLLAVNTVSLSVDPAGEQGLLFTLTIPADMVERASGT